MCIHSRYCTQNRIGNKSHERIVKYVNWGAGTWPVRVVMLSRKCGPYVYALWTQRNLEFVGLVWRSNGV